MLELRPGCEHCNTPLPPDSLDARICSFECTFCADCVALLANVCPNYGGGFMPRPIRPQQNWRNQNNLAHYPASSNVKYRPVNLSEHAQFAEKLQLIPAENR